MVEVEKNTSQAAGSFGVFFSGLYGVFSEWPKWVRITMQQDYQDENKESLTSHGGGICSRADQDLIPFNLDK